MEQQYLHCYSLVGWSALDGYQGINKHSFPNGESTTYGYKVDLALGLEQTTFPWQGRNDTFMNSLKGIA